jgi:Ni,Fe-hydrogenase I large subunit
VRRLFNKCRSDKNPHSLEHFREAQRNYRKEVRKASKNAWRTFCSSINDLRRSARLHRALSMGPKIKLGSLVTPSRGVSSPRDKHYSCC